MEVKERETGKSEIKNSQIQKNRCLTFTSNKPELLASTTPKLRNKSDIFFYSLYSECNGKEDKNNMKGKNVLLLIIIINTM